MENDDPEERIADLERRLAERSAIGERHDASEPGPSGGPLTPEQVHSVAFSKPPAGKRGYNEDQVDRFLDFVEAALRQASGPWFTAEGARSVAFSKPPIGKRGYDEDEVDAFLDAVAAQLDAVEHGHQPPPFDWSPGRRPRPKSWVQRIIESFSGP